MEFTFLDRLLNPVPKARVLIVGSAFVDLLLRVDTLPVSGADVKGDYQDARVGGCSFNVADVFFKLALPCECLLPIGEGMIASLIEKEFNRRHYPLTKFQGKGDNGWCLTLIEKTASVPLSRCQVSSAALSAPGLTPLTCLALTTSISRAISA